MCFCCPDLIDFSFVSRVAQYEGRFPSLVTSVTHARSVFIWWSGFVLRASTSTGSVSAVRPAALLFHRERMLSTLKRVCIYPYISTCTFDPVQRSELTFCCIFTGKLYCKLHFDQRNSGTNLRKNFSPRTVSTEHDHHPDSNNDHFKMCHFSVCHLP